ncbi:MAG: hypothetical protein GY800_10230, partial [Planctomycetes bacterium]|nr:hypothetical protein [Planctomycetota bacterium]
RAVKSGHVPVEVIIQVANEYQENGNPRKAAVLLELLFEGDIGTPDEAHDFALNALCNSDISRAGLRSSIEKKQNSKFGGLSL